MKTTISLLFLSLLLFSCNSTNRCIEVYLNQNLHKDNTKTLVLLDKKSKNSKTLQIYSDIDFIRNMKVSKTYTQEVYDDLEKMAKGDTLPQYWLKTDKTVTYFDGMAYTKDRNWVNYPQKKENAEVHFHAISNPIFTKDKNIAVFFFKVFLDRRNSIEEVAVVMKKVKGKWILLEKVPTQRLQ